MPSEVYNEAFYTEESRVSLRCAEQIVPLIYERFKPASVVDVGCGVGAFLRSFRVLGVETVLGLDGDYLPREKLMVPPEEFRPTDLTKPFALDRRYDLVMCLEVGEHLDAPYADAFVQSLCQLGDIVVFSAAIPVQGGDHHVNEQWQSYWVERFAKCGFSAFDLIRPLIWANGGIEVFYKQNMLVFANAHAVARFPSVLKMENVAKDPKSYDLVHPDMYAMRVGNAHYLSNFIMQMANANQAFRIRPIPGGGFAADPVSYTT